jgi:hypothetical protein
VADRSDIVGTPDETRADKLVHGRINRHHVHDPLVGLGSAHRHSTAGAEQLPPNDIGPPESSPLVAC